MSIKEYIDNKELTYNDLGIWTGDYLEVKIYINSLLNKVKDKPVEEQVDYILDRLHHNNSYDICSDTNFKPVEYIDFNYGSIVGTISFYDRALGELLPTFDGYVRRNGVEEVDPYSDIEVKDVVEVLFNEIRGIE